MVLPLLPGEFAHVNPLGFLLFGAEIICMLHSQVCVPVPVLLNLSSAYSADDPAVIRDVIEVHLIIMDAVDHHCVASRPDFSSPFAGSEKW